MFYVIEFQTSDTTGAAIPFAFEDKNLAEQQYHAMLSAAAVSTVPIHAVALTRGDGTVIKSEYYNHGESEA